jgi:hypothetical protein
MSKHALLSPSGAHRWLNCPLAPRLEAELPDRPNKYAAEGTLAHSVCEITAKKHFKKAKAAEYNKALKKYKADGQWDDEMLTTADLYVEHIAERAMKFEHEPYLAFEVKVDITDYVPDAFGTCDCVMIGGNSLVITDYKHGTGVPVSPAENPQLMLYALGALKLYKPIFGEAIQNVEVYIDQPRLKSYNGWSCSVNELLEWGKVVKPKAEQAYAGIGDYRSGEWCKFCRANGVCKAQMQQETSAFDDFVSVIDKELQNPALMTPEEMSAAIAKGKTLTDWYENVKERTLELLLSGCPIPGWKAVEGRSARVWSNQDLALDTLLASGVERAIIYDTVPKTLAQLEKLIGAKVFDEIVGTFVTKPQGKPALAPVSDSRKEFNKAVADFASVVNENIKGE